MKISNITFLCTILTTTIGFFSSGALGQHYVIKTDSEDSEVYVKNEKVGTGKEVKIALQKVRDIIQIKVMRQGYKTEYTTAIPTETKVEVKNSRKLATKGYGLKSIAIKSFDIDKSLGKHLYESYRYRPFKEGELTERYTGKDCREEIDIDGVNYDLEKAFLVAMASTGFVDTTRTIFKSKDINNLMEVTVYDLKFYFVHTGSPKCYDLSIASEVGITYVLKDKFNNLKMDANILSRSSLFSLMEHDWMSIDFGKRHDLLNLCIQDAIEKGFLDRINMPGTDFFEDNEPLAASKLPKLQLSPTKVVNDAQSAMQATVSIKTESGFGSGCVVSNDGYIISSYHVVSGLNDSTVSIRLGNGEEIKGKIVRTSFLADLVLLKSEYKFPVAFQLQSNVNCELTDEVFAVGTPSSLELSQTVSKGIISAFRNEKSGLNLIQTDVSVNPGNSGGPLLKNPAIFIGLVNSKISGKSIEGLSFCTPVKDVIEYLNLNVK